MLGIHHHGFDASVCEMMRLNGVYIMNMWVHMHISLKECTHLLGYINDRWQLTRSVHPSRHPFVNEVVIFYSLFLINHAMNLKLFGSVGKEEANINCWRIYLSFLLYWWCILYRWNALMVCLLLQTKSFSSLGFNFT